MSRQFSDPFTTCPPRFTYVDDGQRRMGCVTAELGEAFEYAHKVLLGDPNKMEGLNRRLQMVFDCLNPHHIWGIQCTFSEEMAYFTIFPGDRADVYLNKSIGSDLGNHNIDTKIQMVGLWALVSAWFAEVCDTAYWQDSLEQFREMHPLVPDIGKIRYVWQFGDHGKVADDLFTIQVPDDPNTYYSFQRYEMDAESVLHREVSSLFGHDRWDIKVERVDPKDYQKVPLLVPFRPQTNKDEPT